MSTSLSGRFILVTGAARGIGRAIAETLASRDATVAALDLEASDWTHSKIHAFPCDVADPRSVEDALDAVEGHFGLLDGVINNAGIMIEKTIEETSFEDFDKVIAVNLRGVFAVTKVALPMLRKSSKAKRSPKILNIASELAHLGRAEYSAYCASKGGVIGLTRSMALELAPHITVNALAPGPTDTAMLQSEKNYHAWSGTGEGIPLGRVGTVEDIAKVASFMMSDESSFMTGSIVDVNGGAAMY